MTAGPLGGQLWRLCAIHLRRLRLLALPYRLRWIDSKVAISRGAAESGARAMQEPKFDADRPGEPGLIEQCRDCAVACLPSAVSVALGDALNTLVDGRPWIGTDAATEAYEQAITVLRHRRGDLEAAFLARYVHHAESALRQSGGAVEQYRSLSLSKAELMDEDAHSDFSAPDSLAQAITSSCKSELYSLDRRLDAIAANHGKFTSPISPRLIGLSVIEAMRQIGLPGLVRQSLLPPMAEHLPGQVKQVYQTLNQFLLDRCVIPDMILGLPSKGQVGVLAAVCNNWLMRQSQMQSQPAKESGEKDRLEISWLLADLIKGEPDAINLFGLRAQDVASGEAILWRIDQAIGSRLSAADRVVLDWVVALFETRVFVDPIPVVYQAMFGRLQLPVLRAAFDHPETVVRRPDHPIRKLFDTLISLTTCDLSDASIAQVEGIVSAMQRLDANWMDGFQEALDELTIILDTACIGSDSIPCDPIESERRVSEALDSHHIPGAMQAFLQEHWPKVMQVADAAGAEMAMNELIETLEPGNWRHRRSEISARLPALLKKLKTLLITAEIQSEQRDKFFGDLVKCHALLMRATKVPADKKKTEGESKVA